MAKPRGAGDSTSQPRHKQGHTAQSWQRSRPISPRNDVIIRSSSSSNRWSLNLRRSSSHSRFSPLRPHSLPIGNLTSQFLANVFLDPIDHFIKEELQIPGYIRYADDLLLFGDSRQQMWDVANALSSKLATRRLRLHSHKTHVQLTNQPILFMGLRVSRQQLRLSQQGIRRIIRRTRRQRHEFRQGTLSLERIPTSL